MLIRRHMILFMRQYLLLWAPRLWASSSQALYSHSSSGSLLLQGLAILNSVNVFQSFVNCSSLSTLRVQVLPVLSPNVLWTLVWVLNKQTLTNKRTRVFLLLIIPFFWNKMNLSFQLFIQNFGPFKFSLLENPV